MTPRRVEETLVPKLPPNDDPCDGETRSLETHESYGEFPTTPQTFGTVPSTGSKGTEESEGEG